MVGAALGRGHPLGAAVASAARSRGEICGDSGAGREAHGWSSRRLGLLGPTKSPDLHLLATRVDLGPGQPSGETEAGRAAPPSAP